mmetsp:Transcript_13915/g.23900  ORF Transcript_13915/g.23900 Transcript_13915/m.23900 type:complete len:84 (-) Transcript_13915:301-552(-)
MLRATQALLGGLVHKDHGYTRTRKRNYRVRRDLTNQVQLFVKEALAVLQKDKIQEYKALRKAKRAYREAQQAAEQTPVSAAPS